MPARLPDAGRITAELQRLVATAIRHHTMNGFPDGYIQPDGQLTRAQAAQALVPRVG